MIEGHHGSCVCGACLRVAYASVCSDEVPAPTTGDSFKCTMCLEDRTDAKFQSDAYPEAVICRRCIRMAAKALERDPDSNWTNPSKPAST